LDVHDGCLDGLEVRLRIFHAAGRLV
jgi:hypothetical protein